MTLDASLADDRRLPAETAPLAPGEILLLRIRPSPLFLLLSNLAIAALLILLSLMVLPMFLPPPVVGVLDAADLWLVVAAILMLLWNALDWLTRAYILSDRRIMRISGILRRVAVDVPLRNIQSVTLLKSIRERLFGMGTIGVSSAGSDGLEFTWFMIACPQDRLGVIRQATEQVRAVSSPGGLA
jgi:uncharacterized membrane protein YdbT with pleckstrin-like domain